jgi:arginine N-succinyltransferase
MILLRAIQEKDLESLEGFSQIPGFINLPNDRDLLREKVMKSISSFKTRSPGVYGGKYIFVAEDVENGKVLGTSMIAAQHGTVDSPHFYFEVGSEQKYSETISTGFIHGTLTLRADTNGPSEIGGLVLDPHFRNSDARLGRQISFVRFLFLGLNRGCFKKTILAELLPPLNKRGQSPLWEAIGRRFTNMDYWEADRLCQKDKGFIFSLFPSGKIYTTFLSAEARNAIGKVGKDTEPVLHMLKKIGFHYPGHVDPFDGGPHLCASQEDIVPAQNIAQLRYQSGNFVSSRVELSGGQGVSGLLSPISDSPGEFRAIAVKAVIEGEEVRVLDLSSSLLGDVLGLRQNDRVAFIAYY